MARTPKKVRRNGGSCICTDQLLSIKWKVYDESTCKYGYCFSARCQRCRGELFGVGPVGCPCENPPRWTRYPGMQQPGDWDFEKDVFVPERAAVKPSIARRSRGSRHFR
jgi:hypothetical protein